MVFRDYPIAVPARTVTGSRFDRQSLILSYSHTLHSGSRFPGLQPEPVADNGSMRILNKLLHLYREYKFLMWILSLSGLLAPILTYTGYALNLVRQRKQLTADDNPELAEDMTTLSPFDWLDNMSGILPHVMRILAIIGVILFLLVVTLKIVGGITDRTRLSGSQYEGDGSDGGEDTPDTGDDDDEDDGRIDDYGTEL